MSERRKISVTVTVWTDDPDATIEQLNTDVRDGLDFIIDANEAPYISELTITNNSTGIGEDDVQVLLDLLQEEVNVCSYVLVNETLSVDESMETCRRRSQAIALQQILQR